MSKICFKGRGQIALASAAALAAGTAGALPVGNAPMLSVSASEKTEKIPDYTSSAGGTHSSIREIEGAEVSMQLYIHSAENLVRALHGSGATDNVAEAVVANEPVVAWAGAIAPLADLPDLSVAIVVKDAPTGLITYVEGTDYLVTEGGSIVVLAGGAIAAPVVAGGVGAANIKVSYTRRKQSLVQLLTKASAPVYLLFDGVNIIDGSAARFALFKVEFGPAQKVDLIGDAVSKLDFTGDIQRDESKPRGTAAAPFSQYGTLRF